MCHSREGGNPESLKSECGTDNKVITTISLHTINR